MKDAVGFHTTEDALDAIFMDGGSEVPIKHMTVVREDGKIYTLKVHNDGAVEAREVI